jgi:hypothetical protein
MLSNAPAQRQRGTHGSKTPRCSDVGCVVVPSTNHSGVTFGAAARGQNRRSRTLYVPGCR